MDLSAPGHPIFGEPTYSMVDLTGASFLNTEKGGGSVDGSVLSSNSAFKSISSALTRLLFRSFLFSKVIFASGRFSVIRLSIIFSAAPSFLC